MKRDRHAFALQRKQKETDEKCCGPSHMFLWIELQVDYEDIMYTNLRYKEHEEYLLPD